MTNDNQLASTRNGTQTASFNLKAVVQETGLKPDTLRAWERRYDLPQPKRTPGGHRLYTQRDIDTLKWLVDRQSNGLSISRAVDLWRKLEADNKDPLVVMALSTQEAPAPALSVGSTLIDLRNQWVNACTEFDEQAAEHVLSQALAMYPAETVCFDLLQKGLSQIGVGWYEGKLTAQQEHFASALAMRRLEALVGATPPPTRTGRVLIGCAPEEEHTFSALLLTLLMRRRGWEALYLGANVPMARLEATIASTEPKLVVMIAQTLWTASELFSMAEILVREDVPLAYGGLIFSMNSALHKRIPGHFLGSRLEEAPVQIEQLLTKGSFRPNHIQPDDEYAAASEYFTSHQAKLEATIWELMSDIDILPNYLLRANRDLSRSIASALKLGNIELVGTDFHAIEGLVMNYHYHMPRELLTDYIQAYRDAAEQTLDEHSRIIVNWLDELLLIE